MIGTDTDPTGSVTLADPGVAPGGSGLTPSAPPVTFSAGAAPSAPLDGSSGNPAPTPPPAPSGASAGSGVASAPQFKPPDTTEDDAAIAEDRAAARAAQAKATDYDLKMADQAEATAQQLKDAQAQAAAQAMQVPDQAAIFQNSMHMAAPLATMMAIGGRAMGLSGSNMLGALTGMIKGMNAGAASTVEQQWAKYKANADAMKANIDNLLQYNKLMLEAYAGRSDAYQKAAEAARRMAGDELDAKKLKFAQSLDQFKILREASEFHQREVDKMDAHMEKVREFNEREGRLEEAARMVAMKADPRAKLQMQGLKQQYDNYKTQVAEIQRAMGQYRNDLTVKGDKTAALAQMQAKIDQLQGRMSAVSDQIQQLASQPYQAGPAAGAGVGTSPAAAPPARAGLDSVPDINTAPRVPSVADLKPNVVSTYPDGSKWTLGADGKPQQIQAATQ